MHFLLLSWALSVTTVCIEVDVFGFLRGFYLFFFLWLQTEKQWNLEGELFCPVISETMVDCASGNPSSVAVVLEHGEV